MKKNLPHKPNILTPVMEERIINVAYGNASLLDQLMVGYLRSRNPKVEQSLASHQKIIQTSREHWNKIRVSRGFESRLLAITEVEEERQLSGFWDFLHWPKQWIQAGAVFSVLAVGLLIWNDSMQEAKQRELEAATLQVKASLAMISEIMNGTTQTVKQDVIMKHTSKPLQNSILRGTQTIKEHI